MTAAGVSEKEDALHICHVANHRIDLYSVTETPVKGLMLPETE